MAEEALHAIREFYRLDERVGTAGQPEPEQFAAVASAGFEVVVNLLPASQEQPGEAERVHALGMEYVRIPVWWDSPEFYDLERFFEVMTTFQNRRVFIHCAANKRVSAFLYLYRVLRCGVPEAEAAETLRLQWEPNPIWRTFLNRARRRWARKELQPPSGE